MKKVTWTALFLVSNLVILPLIMLPAMNGPFVLDDRPKILRNPDIKDLNNITSKLIYPYADNQSFYRNDPSRPLVYFSYATNYKIHGLSPAGYRYVNLVLHIANALLLYLILLLLFKPLMARGPPAAFFAAMIFSFHPLNVPISLYVFNRSVSMAAFFMLLGFLAHLKIKKPILSLITVVICFVCALASRQDAIVFALLIPAYDFLFENKKISKTHIGLWATAGSYLLLRLLLFGQIGDAEAQNITWGRGEYLLKQISLLPQYVGKLIFPHKLSIYYNQRIFDQSYFVFLTIFVFFLGALYYQRKALFFRFRTEFLFSIVMFVIFWGPTSTLLPTTTLFAENRVYLAGVGVFVIISLLAARIKKFNLLCLLVLTTLTVMTAQRAQIFASAVSLWEDTVKSEPTSFAYNNLGLAYKEVGQLEKARQNYLQALALNPINEKALNNLANVLVDEGKYSEANEVYLKAMSLGLDHPVVYFNLGRSYFLMGNLTEAKVYVEQAVDRDPSYQKAQALLDEIYSRLRPEQ